MSEASASALDELVSLKSTFDPASARRVEELLACLRTAALDTPQDLLRLHETLLFVRAYPHSRAVMKLADDLLAGFADRMSAIDPEVIQDAFDDPEHSGIDGTRLSSNFSYEIARGLCTRYPNAVAIDWDDYEHPERLGAVLAQTFPAANELWTVEPHVHWSAWFTASGLTLSWLLKNIPPRTYDLLELPILWTFRDSPASRTLARLPHGRPFLHSGPLLRRSDVSLEAEFASAPVATTKLPASSARPILQTIADSSAARYRELWGFTHPDARHVYHAALGRGCDFYFFGVPAAFRLPLRAYHCGMFAKNGVPIGYVETLSLFERAEVGFNLYYTFREGETAWLYARMLKVLREHLGVSAFSIDPYQIGHDNEEAIDSGAFWFYRKLGFRPTAPDVLGLVHREEERIAARPGYRTPASTLRRMARAPLIYGPPESDAWGAFSLDHLAQRMGKGTAAGFDNPILLRAKDAPEERGYLKLLQRDPDLRAKLLLQGRAQP